MKMSSPIYTSSFLLTPSSSPSTTATERDLKQRLPIIRVESSGGVSPSDDSLNNAFPTTAVEDERVVPLLNERRQQQRAWLSEGSIKASIFNLTNATLGAGIVSVPFAMMSLGLGLGVLIITLLAFASTVATKALVSVLNHTSANSFESIAHLAGGRSFSLFVQLTLLLFNFGSAIGYLICIKDVFSVIVKAYELESVVPESLFLVLSPQAFLTFVCFFLLLPMCSVDKLSKLRMASLLGLVALELLVVVTCIMMFQKGVHSSLGSFPYIQSLLPKSLKNVFRGIPLLVFAFSCHSNAPSIYNELENQSYRRMAKVSLRSVLTAFATYLIMGVSGFFIFGNSVAPNVLTNFTSDLKNSVSLLIAFIGILVGVLLSYPTNIFPCRSSVEMALSPDGIISPMATKIVTFSLVVTSLCIALIMPSLAVLFSLTGSTCGACVAFIFPGRSALSLFLDFCSLTFTWIFDTSQFILVPTNGDLAGSFSSLEQVMDMA